MLLCSSRVPRRFEDGVISVEIPASQGEETKRDCGANVCVGSHQPVQVLGLGLSQEPRRSPLFSGRLDKERCGGSEENTFYQLVLDHSDLIWERNNCFSTKPLKEGSCLNSRSYYTQTKVWEFHIFHNFMITRTRYFSIMPI